MRGKKFFFCFVEWFCCFLLRWQFFSFSHGTRGINKENSLNPSLSSCHTILFLSNQASFIHFSLPGSHTYRTVSFSVCVLSYLRFYLNGVDIQLKHSLTHCTFKARGVLRQFLCAFQAFSSRSLHSSSIFFFFFLFHIAFRASNSKHDCDQGETELMKKCIKHIKGK